MKRPLPDKAHMKKIAERDLSRIFSTIAVAIVCSIFLQSEALAGNSDDPSVRLNKHKIRIIIEGPIKAGTYRKFERLIKESKGKVIGVDLASPGGLVDEAIKIGRLIRKLRLSTAVPHSQYKKRCYLIDTYDIKNCSCESACFLIFVGGVKRDGTIVGIHRASFSHSYLKEVSSSKALKLGKMAKESVASYLAEMDVPKSFVERALATSSQEMDFLSFEETQKYFYGFIPEIDEWVRSRCGDGNKAHNDLFSIVASTNDFAAIAKVEATVDKYNRCESNQMFEMAMEAYTEHFETKQNKSKLK